MNPFISGKEISVRGSVFRTARLRHEWCDFYLDPSSAVKQMRDRAIADLFTFVVDLGDSPGLYPYHVEKNPIAVLPVVSYEHWWELIGKKKRNQIRKAQKSGVVLRTVALDSSFALGVEPIYNESPVRQGRKFCHYGQTAEEIELELRSFVDRSIFIGAYVESEMVGFMKLFRANHSLRIVHILAKLNERDRCVMDALIGKAVELCLHHQREYLHYGSWADGGIGAFRMKHGFRRAEVPRYWVPLSLRGNLMLQLNLHHSLRDHIPSGLVAPLLRLRARWNSTHISSDREPAL